MKTLKQLLILSCILLLSCQTKPVPIEYGVDGCHFCMGHKAIRTYVRIERRIIHSAPKPAWNGITSVAAHSCTRPFLYPLKRFFCVVCPPDSDKPRTFLRRNTAGLFQCR